MSTSPRQFHAELYREHLEEASFLYDQRRTLFPNPEIPWTRISDFEDRFEAHIDALVVGGELGLQVCQKQAAEGDAGELHAAVRVFCRQNRKDLFLRAVDGLDLDAADKCRALVDAVCHELPDAWQADWVGMLARPEPRWIPLVARVVGYRRLKDDVYLLPALPKTPAGGVPTVLWALGRLGDASAGAPLYQHWLNHADEAVRSAAALALLRLHEPHMPNYCMTGAYEANSPTLALGLGGGRLVVRALLDPSSPGKATADGSLALGLLGDATAVGTLQQRLADPDGAEAAAVALYLITGAHLWEEAVIPDVIDDDELFDDEREKLKKGEPLTPPGGRPPGTRITRISQNPEHWTAWWFDNQPRFNPRIRYRLGQDYSPAVLLETLESERSPHQVRQFAYEELVIRYGADVPFEADWPVTRQRQVLAVLRDWVKANASRFHKGAWYYGGRPSA